MSGEAPAAATGRRRVSGRRAAPWLRYRSVRVLLGAALAAWGLVAWQTLRPPVAIPLPPFSLEDMVYCRGGLLIRRAPPEAVSVAAFWIDRFEVTCADYARFLEDHPELEGIPDPAWIDGRMPLPSAAEFPVTRVTLEDAAHYAKWLGKRLPSSAEWEWAARGPFEQRYPWGDLEPAGTLANTADAGFGGPTPVGLFESGRSPSGVYDMVGNVEEWTSTRAPGLFSDRYLTRGGSYLDPILEVDRKTTIMDTHRYDERADGSGWIPRTEKLQGPKAFAPDRGFRCVRDAGAVERERQVREAAAELGARDPVRWLRQTWPAMRALREIGGDALPTLRHARDHVADESIRARIDELIRDLGRDG